MYIEANDASSKEKNVQSESYHRSMIIRFTLVLEIFLRPC